MHGRDAMKKAPKPPASADDAGLFRASMSGVTPLRGVDKVAHERPPPAPIPVQRLLNDRETLQESLSDRSPWDPATETGDELTYARFGLGLQTLRKLRRGYWVTQGELDLHGYTVAQAKEILVCFLDECERRGWRCVRIIHGKGLRSRNREPVLKHKVAHWLRQREEILGFCQAQRVDGGSGAMMVLLRGGKNRSDR
jgi:DNA-nicking Smr family endonuclease